MSAVRERISKDEAVRIAEDVSKKFGPMPDAPGRLNKLPPVLTPSVAEHRRRAALEDAAATLEMRLAAEYFARAAEWLLATGRTAASYRYTQAGRVFEWLWRHKTDRRLRT